MRALRDKIYEECNKARTLSELQQKVDNSFEISKRIDEEQQKHWDKFIFFKNLSNAYEKNKKRNNEGNN